MQFSSPLQSAILLRRYKRFLADIELPDGTHTTVHCANPGAMLGVAPEGARCWVSRSASRTRKLPLSLEIVECPSAAGGTALVGINTHHPNRLAEEAILSGLVDGLSPDAIIRREVRYGAEKSRIDLLLDPDGRMPTFVEVKNCHLLRRADGITEFPDCVTVRGLKHLRELSGVVAEGGRAVLLFVVQRADATGVAPADDLDPAYGRGLRDAAAAGVELRAVRCEVSPSEIQPDRLLPVILDI